MKFRNALARWLAFAVTSATVLAHGGRYLGPGSTFVGEPASFGTPAGESPAGVDGCASKFPPLLSWQFWWESNQPYLLATAARNAPEELQAPTLDDLRARVLPELFRTLERERANDIVTGALIAVARVGHRLDDAESRAIALRVTPFLANPSQEIAETAALALGVLGRDELLEPLAHLALDDGEGRALAKSNAVPLRTRVFAVYALGVLRDRTSSAPVRQRIEALCVCLLADYARGLPELRQASVAALGATPLPRADGFTHARETSEARLADLTYLTRLLDDAAEPALLRAHVPRALANLALATSADAVQSVTRTLLAHLSDEPHDVLEIRQACALALGQIADADDDELDRKVRARLSKLASRDRDPQLRAFALIALAQAGGRAGTAKQSGAGAAAVQKFLAERLTAASAASDLPWIALALGVHARACATSGLAIDAQVGTALRGALTTHHTPDGCAALALACGLARDAAARERLLELLQTGPTDEARAYTAIGLGLLGDRSVILALEEVVKRAKYRPSLLRGLATGLGLLRKGDEQGAACKQLEEAKGTSCLASLAQSFGFRRDARSLATLVAMLANDPKRTDSARGYAAVAIGLVCDREPVPWSASFAVDVDYRAGTFTLVGANDEFSGLIAIL